MDAENDKDDFDKSVDELEAEKNSVDEFALAAYINKNEEAYQIDLIELLLDFLSKIPKDEKFSKIRRKISIGPYIDGHSPLSDRTISDIHEKFLQNLEKEDIIRGLKVCVDYMGDPMDGFDEEVIAEMSFIPNDMEMHLKKVLPKLEELRAKKRKAQNPIRLSEYRIYFNKEMGAVVVGSFVCKLPPFQNEFDLCKIVFSYDINTPVEWTLINKEITGQEHSEVRIKDEKLSREVRDTMYRVNKRIRDFLNTKDDLFSWKNKCVIRNF